MSDDEYASSVSVLDSDQDVEFDNLQVAIGPQDGAPNNDVDNMSDSQLLAKVEHLQNEGSGDPAVVTLAKTCSPTKAFTTNVHGCVSEEERPLKTILVLRM